MIISHNMIDAEKIGALQDYIFSGTEMTALQKIAADEREKCVRELEQFVREYVAKWIGTQGESIKAEAWAILQAAEHLRSGLDA